MVSSNRELMDYLDKVDRRTPCSTLSKDQTKKKTEALIKHTTKDPEGTILFGGNIDSHNLWGMAYLLRAARWKHEDKKYLERLQKVDPFQRDTERTSTGALLESHLWTDLAALQTPLIHEQERTDLEALAKLIYREELDFEKTTADLNTYLELSHLWTSTRLPFVLKTYMKASNFKIFNFGYDEHTLEGLYFICQAAEIEYLCPISKPELWAKVTRLENNLDKIPTWCFEQTILRFYYWIKLVDGDALFVTRNVSPLLLSEIRKVLSSYKNTCEDWRSREYAATEFYKWIGSEPPDPNLCEIGILVRRNVPSAGYRPDQTCQVCMTFLTGDKFPESMITSTCQHPVCQRNTRPN